MCGLVGILGNITSRDSTLFSQMLLADELRGKHATGVARVVTDNTSLSVGYGKLAIAASFFRHLPIFDTLTAVTPSLTALLGHNRHATKGASDNHKYAHPFKHGHITLMHNGSLTTHYSLTKETFTVDSEAICSAFAQGNPVDIIPTLRGAFALVWVDERDQTINFVRNSERTLSFAFDEKGDKLYWASEKNMLKWLLERDMTFASGGFDYDMLTDLPVGEIWTLPLKQNKASISDLVKTPVQLTTTPTYHNYGSGQGGATNHAKKSYSGQSAGNSGGQSAASSSGSVASSRIVASHPLVANNVGTDYLLTEGLEKSLAENVTKMIEQSGRVYPANRSYITVCDSEGTALDKRLAFFITGFEEYPGTAHTTVKSGKLTGRLVEYPFSRVVVHACPKDRYENLMTKSHGVGSSYVLGLAADPVISGSVRLTDVQARDNMSLTLRADCVKQVEDVTRLHFDDGNFPAEWVASVDNEELNRIKNVAELEAEYLESMQQKK